MNAGGSTIQRLVTMFFCLQSRKIYMAKSGSGIDNWEIEGCMLIEMGMYFKSSNSKLVYKLEEKRATARRYTRIFFR